MEHPFALHGEYNYDAAEARLVSSSRKREGDWKTGSSRTAPQTVLEFPPMFVQPTDA